MTTPQRIPAFQFYPHRWLGSMAVMSMPAAVEGTYWRLLVVLWAALTQSETPQYLPTDPREIQPLTKLSAREWAGAWAKLERHFPANEAGTGRTNPTLEAVWREQLEYRARQATNGAHGGRPPKASGKPPAAPAKPTDPAHGNPRESQNNPPVTRGLSRPEPTENPPESPVPVPVPVIPISTPDGVELPPTHPAVLLELAIADAVRPIVHDESRAAMARFLLEQGCRPASWPSWVRRVIAWADGFNISAKIPWPSIATGITELLDVNPEGRVITPMVLRIFVEKAPRPGDTRHSDAGGEWDALKRRLAAGEPIEAQA